MTGFPVPNVTWTAQKKPLSSTGPVQITTKDTDSTVTVKPCSRSHSGMYQVSAENVVGTANSEFEVMIKDKPSPPRDLKVDEVQRESIGVSWQRPEDDGGSPITGYVIEKRDAKKTSWSSAGKSKPDQLNSSLTKLIEGNEYFIRVSAENEIGVSDPVETPNAIKAKSPFGEYFVSDIVSGGSSIICVRRMKLLIRFDLFKFSLSY